jgi:ribonuclease Z
LLLHEATLSKTMREIAVQRGHSTAEMAGEFATKINAKTLVLTHFSRSEEEEENNYLEAQKREASAVFKNEIILARDFMRIAVK